MVAKICLFVIAVNSTPLAPSGRSECKGPALRTSRENGQFFGPAVRVRRDERVKRTLMDIYPSILLQCD